MIFYIYLLLIQKGVYRNLMRRPKKSKYKSVVIKKKRYYFYKITWADITGDSGHATQFDSSWDSYHLL